MRALVLVHGMTGAPSAWDAVVRALPSSMPVWRPALLGHRGGPEHAAHFDAYVDALAAAISRATREAHVVGYSAGGRVALGLLLRHPQLVRRATLLGAHPGLLDDDARRARREDDERWAQLLEHEGIEPFADAWESQPLFASQARVEPSVLAEHRARRRSHEPRALAHAFRVLGLGAMPARQDALARATTPITWAVGGDDSKFRSLLAPYAPRVIADAGHDVVLERPDAVAALLLEQEAS